MATFAAQIQAALTSMGVTTAEAAGVDLAVLSSLAAGAINRRLPSHTTDVDDEVLELGYTYAETLLRRRQRIDDLPTSNAELARILEEADMLASAERQEAGLPVTGLTDEEQEAEEDEDD